MPPALTFFLAASYIHKLYVPPKHSLFWPSYLSFHHWYASTVLFSFAPCYSHKKRLQLWLTNQGLDIGNFINWIHAFQLI